MNVWVLVNMLTQYGRWFVDGPEAIAEWESQRGKYAEARERGMKPGPEPRLFRVVAQEHVELSPEDVILLERQPVTTYSTGPNSEAPTNG